MAGVTIGTVQGPERTLPAALPAPAVQTESPVSQGDLALFTKGLNIGTKIGKAGGLSFVGTVLIRKGLLGSGAPMTLFGKAFSGVGAVFSAYSSVEDALEIRKDLSNPKASKETVAHDALDLAGDLLVAGGSAAMLTGWGATPGLIASGAGLVLEGAAALLTPNQAAAQGALLQRVGKMLKG